MWRVKQLLLIFAVTALVGCGKKESPEPRAKSKATTKAGLKNPKPAKPVSAKLIIDPFVEKEIRRRLEKPKGALTKEDLDGVRTLTLNYTKISDAGLKEVAKLPNLTSLDLMYCKQITDAGLKELVKLKELATLILTGTKITDTGLKEVIQLKQLEVLYLRSAQISDAGLKELAKLSNLRMLDLGTSQITDAGLKEVAKLQQLKELRLDGTEATDAGLSKLVKLQLLTTLNLLDTKVTKECVAELQKALPDCNIYSTAKK